MNNQPLPSNAVTNRFLPGLGRTAPIPRTMQQAFGPYTSRDLQGPADRINARGHSAVLLVGIMGLCVFAGLFVAGVL